MSQRSSPGAGASAASVAARTYRLVSCPSCSYASSGRPGAAPSRSVPGSRTQSSARTCRASVRSCGQSAAVASRSRSAGPPSCSRTRTRVPPQPVRRSSAATSAGVPGPSPRTRSRAAGVEGGGERGERPGDEGDGLDVLQGPAEAGAGVRDGGGVRVDAEGRGAAWVSARVRAMPWKDGSPLARTATARPSWASSSPGTAGRRGEGQAIRSPGHSPHGEEVELARGADQHLGGAQGAAGVLGESVPPVRADSDDRYRSVHVRDST